MNSNSWDKMKNLLDLLSTRERLAEKLVSFWRRGTRLLESALR